MQSCSSKTKRVRTRSLPRSNRQIWLGRWAIHKWNRNYKTEDIQMVWIINTLHYKCKGSKKGDILLKEFLSNLKACSCSEVIHMFFTIWGIPYKVTCNTYKILLNRKLDNKITLVALLTFAKAWSSICIQNWWPSFLENLVLTIMMLMIPHNEYKLACKIWISLKMHISGAHRPSEFQEIRIRLKNIINSYFCGFLSKNCYCHHYHQNKK